MNKLSQAALRDTLLEHYTLGSMSIEQLHLGADADTTVYAATNGVQKAFVKVRQGQFDPATILVPDHMNRQGITQVIAALPTSSGAKWVSIGEQTLFVFPFVSGANGFEQALTDHQRISFGHLIRQFHEMSFPDTLVASVRRETFADVWREALGALLRNDFRVVDAFARRLPEMLDLYREPLERLLKRASSLAARVRRREHTMILCHGDAHGWNMLIDQAGKLYLIDWDTLVLAPKERDLMFVGCGLGGRGHDLVRETALFYIGYGEVDVDEELLAYYRYERIVEDLVLYGWDVLDSDLPLAERLQAITILESNLRPSNTLAIAFDLDGAGE